MSNCDKCDQPVDPKNDATVLQSILDKEPLTRLFYRPRHLLPIVDDDGHVLCEGSPSRAQYLPDQQLDARDEYRRGGDNHKAAIQSAYSQMQTGV